jgi:hypothetical protein
MNTTNIDTVHRWALLPLEFVVGVYCLGIALLTACTAHPSTIRADRVFVDDGHTYRAYRNDRQGLITHDGACPHPMHRQVDTVYMYGTTQGAKP